MLRILVAVFFWLSAVGLLGLSIRAELVEARKSIAKPLNPVKLGAHSGHRPR
jgi:hypothetical protein